LFSGNAHKFSFGDNEYIVTYDGLGSAKDKGFMIIELWLSLN